MVGKSSQAIVSVPEAVPCSSCGEQIEGSRAPLRCPFGGEEGCTLLLPSEEATDDPLGRTASYSPELTRADEPDGFPELDDLAESTLGQYRVGPIIGRGTMGRVYRAEHLGLGRPCAVKVMNPGLVAREPKLVERFWAEARAVAGLIHPNIVTVHNLGSERGYHFIEMELVEHRRPHWREALEPDGSFRREFVPGGVSLTEKVVREGAMGPQRATTVVREVALALEAAHGAGLVHRDVKPANVLLTADGRAKLADFGLVRRLAEVEHSGSRGRLAGTPTFMAPELFAGAPASPATDLYAVGVMYYYLLTARLPYTSTRLGTLIRLHQKAPVPDVHALVPEVPMEVAAILERLLAKEPGRRYGAAGSLAADLRGVLGHLRSTDALVRDAVAGLGGLIQQGGREGYRLIVPVPGGRLQEVYIEVVEGWRQERLLAVFSVCGPADPDHYEYALKLNAELTQGSLSIRTVNGQAMFVMTRTFPRGQVSPLEIRSAIVEIARHSDRVEQRLTSSDLF